MATVRHVRTAGTRWWWRLRRNPLRPRSYLVEGWLLPATWTLALLAAVAAGVLTADFVERDAASLRTERHPVSAVLTEDPVRSTPAVDGAGSAEDWAGVRWTAPDGTTHTGVARVEAGDKVGSTTRVWLDDQGRLVPAPATAGQARLQGVALGMVAVVTGAVAVLLVCRCGCAWLDRRRLARRETEWARMDRQRGGRKG
ncbi:Rv1733c family protein [Streptomyces sp. NPDC054770]